MFFILFPSFTVSAQCGKELQGWIDLLRREEKNLIECLGHGTYIPDEDIPCNEQEILNLQVRKRSQVRICNGSSLSASFGYTWDQINIGDYIIQFIEFSNYKNSSDRNILEMTIKFTNNSNKSTSYNSAIYREVYQDGYELESYVMGNKDTMTKIRPGMAIEVTECFEYREPKNKGVIEIDLQPYFDNDSTNMFSGVIYKLK